MLPIILSGCTFISTLLGGITALRNRDRLHLILGFTAGVLVAVVAFDIMPEIFNITYQGHYDPTVAMGALVAAFLGFHIFEKLVIIHHAHDDDYGEHDNHVPQVGLLAALALSGHSFFDGVGIGLAFQVNTTVGLAVATAVIAHDFSDGLNTVSLMLAHGNKPNKSAMLLLLDATTPLLGAASTLFFRLPEKGLLIYLGVFAGFLLYIGAADILPEAHSRHPSRLTILMTIIGALFIFTVTRVGL